MSIFWPRLSTTYKLLEIQSTATATGDQAPGTLRKESYTLYTLYVCFVGHCCDQIKVYLKINIKDLLENCDKSVISNCFGGIVFFLSIALKRRQKIVWKTAINLATLNRFAFNNSDKLLDFQQIKPSSIFIFFNSTSICHSHSVKKVTTNSPVVSLVYRLCPGVIHLHLVDLSFVGVGEE